MQWIRVMATEAVKKVGFTEITIEEQCIGSGAYGCVFMATCNKLPCAAKKIHNALVQPHEEAVGANEYRTPFRRFESEFQLLQELRHSNIIQYLGMHVDPATKLPVILMELMDTNLTKYFEKSPEPLAYYVQVNLCLDITRALLFLHVNGIVHRDLSGGNILLTGKPLRAKVSDFGMAKFLNTQLSHMTHTNAPGTVVYMPPEAFGDEFKASGDVFSFAVLLIQILTQKFPDPQGRVADRIIEEEKIKVLVKECQRRRNHISLIPEDHPLLPIALDCLEDDETNRPLVSDLCDRLASITETTLYTENKQAEENPSTTLASDLCDRLASITETTENKQAEENPSTIVDEKEIKFSDFVFITDDKKLTQAEEALQKSEEENKGVKDILEAKLKVLNSLVERNDEVLKIQKQNEDTLEQKEKDIQNLSSDKAEIEQKVKNLGDKNEQQQQTINEQKKQSDILSLQIGNHLQTITEYDKQINEGKNHISHQLETITKHEEHISELSLQLEQQSLVISQQEQKIEELLSQISAKKKNSASFFERMFKRTPASAKDDTNELDKIETEHNNINQTSTSTPPSPTSPPAVDPKATATEPALLDIESLKQTDPNHKDSGLTENTLKTWDRIETNESDDTQVIDTQLDTHVPLDEQVREKAAEKRLVTASDNAVVTLSDAHRIGVITNETLQRQGSSIDKIERRHEQMQTDLEQCKETVSPSTQPTSKKSQKTKKKHSSSKPTRTDKLSNKSHGSNPSRTSVKTEEMKSREQLAIERLDASSARTLKNLEETQKLCVATTEELKGQGEKLGRVEKHQEQMDADFTQGKQNVESDTVKSSFGSHRSKKDGRTQSLGKRPPKPEKPKEPANPPAPQRATKQLRKLPSLGSAAADANAERMSELLSGMAVMGRNMGEMLDQDNGKLDRIQTLTDRNHTAFRAANKDIRKLL